MLNNYKLLRIISSRKKNAQPVTGICFQWRGSASYDSDVHIETFFLRGKFSGEIATEQQPPKRYGQLFKKLAETQTRQWQNNKLRLLEN